MQYDLMHLSVLLKEQSDAFERRGKGGKVPTHEEWLRGIFGKPIPFSHRGGRYHYAPEADIDKQIIVGRVGRLGTAVENAPPEENLREITRSKWTASVVMIDPRHHKEGQKVAMESRPAVGRPISLFESLAVQINASDPPEPYALAVAAIAEEATFWTFVKENEGQITNASFELIAPNMFDQESDFDREMAEMKKQEKIQKVKFTLESEEGLNLNTKRVQKTAKYASQGGGVIKAKTRTGKRFSSSARGKKVSVSAPVRPKKEDPQETIVDWIVRSIKAVFR